MPSAFDTVAEAYDEVFTDTPLGIMLRERVRAISLKLIPATNSGALLEINCGTGEDAIWWAQEGWKVLATDASAGMIERAKAKAGGRQVPEFRVCSFSDLHTLPHGGYRLVFSNFGGLNCISPKEIEDLGAILYQKLQPGGYLILVVMGRFSGWETLYFLLKGRMKAAFRRLRKESQEATLDAETVVPTWYYSPSLLEKRLRAGEKELPWQKVALRPIGLWLPPSYLSPFFSKFPRLLRLLYRLECHGSPAFLSALADHYLLCLRR